MELDGKEFNHAHALSLNDYGNNFNLKALSITSASLNESLTSMNNWNEGMDL